MSILAAYRAAQVLVDLGHANSGFIPHADMNMAADLADVPRPANSSDRHEVIDALDAVGGIR